MGGGKVAGGGARGRQQQTTNTSPVTTNNNGEVTNKITAMGTITNNVGSGMVGIIENTGNKIVTTTITMNWQRGRGYHRGNRS